MESNNTQQLTNATLSTSPLQQGTSPKPNSSPEAPSDNQPVPSTSKTEGTSNVLATDMAQLGCNILSPTLADILSDDRILRFYQCVKEIKLQQSPQHTSSMFFALCHALGDSVSFLKVPNMNKIMFRQDEQIFAVNIPEAITTNDTQSSDTTTSTVQFPHMIHSATATDSSATSRDQISPPQNGNHATDDNLAAAAAAAANYFSAVNQSPQAALSSVGPHDSDVPAVPNAVGIPTKSTTTGARRRGTVDKRARKASPRDKEYAIRRNDIIHDLLKVSEADLFHQANTVDNDVKSLIQGQEKTTKIGASSPLHRFATFANLAAHYDSDFAPKNAGVYYNYEYFQLYAAYRDLEIERSIQEQQASQSSSDPVGPHPAVTSPTSVSRPVLLQCRADIERVLVNTNWEAIRRRLTIGERICQISGILGRGYLLLSKQVSGRKLLHNFNTSEWGEFLREFKRPETLSLLHNLQFKLSPQRLYQNQPPQYPVYSQYNSTSQPLAAPDAVATNNSSSPPPQTSASPENSRLSAARQAPLVIPYASNSPPPSSDNADPSITIPKEEEQKYKKAKVEQD